jgi:hypothetical protein
MYPEFETICFFLYEKSIFILDPYLMPTIGGQKPGFTLMLGFIGSG